MRKMFLAALIGGTALVLAACGEENGESKVQNAVKETAKAVDKTADHAEELDPAEDRDDRRRDVEQKCLIQVVLDHLIFLVTDQKGDDKADPGDVADD